MLVRLEVLLGATPEEAEAELAGLDAVAPWRVTVGRFRFVGAAAGLAATLVDWAAGAAADGFVLQAARLPVDLDRFVHGVVPTLSRAGVFRGAYDGPQLRDHFGLSRPTNRYTAGV